MTPTHYDPHGPPPVYVLVHPRRASLTVEALKAAGVPHVAHVNVDPALPPGCKLQPIYNKLNVTGHYRVFRSHQELMRRFLQETDAPVGLFFEDDASPNTPDWPLVVRDCIRFLKQSDLGCFFLYGRQFDRKQYFRRALIGDREVLSLRFDCKRKPTDYGGKHHCYGTLAFLVTRPAAQLIADLHWEGLPVDVAIPDFFGERFAVLDPSPFDHDRRQGSLIEGTLKPDVQPLKV